MSNARYNLFPSKPFLFVQHTANYTQSKSALLQFSTVRQSRNMSWNTSTNTFTIPETGVYTISVATRLNTNVLDYIYQVLRVNGSDFPNDDALILSNPASGTSFQTVNGSIQVELTENDSVGVRVSWDSSTTSFTAYGQQCWLSAALMA